VTAFPVAVGSTLAATPLILLGGYLALFQ